MKICKLFCITLLSTIYVIFIALKTCSGNKVASGNWTVEDLLKHRQNRTLNQMASLNCTTFYSIEETTRYLNECTLEVVGNGSSKPTNLHPSRRHISDLGQQINQNDKDFDQRTKRGLAIGEKEFLPSGLRIRVNNPWRIMETKTILDFPCVGHCMLQRMTILDETGDPQREIIISKLLQVLEVANGTREEAVEIGDRCIKRLERRLAKISQSTESPEVQKVEKCRTSSRFGICLSKDVYNHCRDAFIGSVTSTKWRQGHPSHNPKDTE